MARKTSAWGGVIVISLLAAGAGFVLPDWYGIGFHCRSGNPTATSPRKALDRYYQGCFRKPRIELLGGGDKASSSYSAYNAVTEYEVNDSRSTRFALVGQRTPGGPWRVLEAEDSGP